MAMITRILFTLLIAVSLWGGQGWAASETAGLLTPHEDTLLALINQARQNPLAVAASMGMDPEKIVKDLPGLEKILREGLPPVTSNGRLAEAARSHTKDMFAKGYYSHDSPEGVGYDARIRNSGYLAAATGESLGMLFFANFINPGDAVRFIFEYMFSDELDPARKEKRNILDPNLKDAGVGIDTGVLILGGAPWNVYLATVDFGAALVTELEGELLRLINQARANPLGVAASLGINTTIYLQGRPELRAAFAKGLPPLTINRSLLSASQGHVTDMLDNNYYGKVSPDGRTYLDRIAASGYRFVAAGESLNSAWFFSPIDPLLAVNRILKSMLQDEFNPSNAGELTILNPLMQEAGITLKKGAFRVGGGELKVYLAVCDVGLPLPVDPVAVPK